MLCIYVYKCVYNTHGCIVLDPMLPLSSRFILSAVAPAVVVPSMLSLTERGYGTDQGIPTLVIAAARVDDILAITGFTILLGVAFSQGQFKFKANTAVLKI